MSYLGIEIGSSQVKAVAFDEKGNALASAVCKYDYTIPSPGRMELDSDEVIRGAFSVIAECAAQVKEVSPVRALACSSQGEAFTLLDAACAVINNMASFDEAGIDDSYLDEIRKGDKFSVEV